MAGVKAGSAAGQVETITAARYRSLYQGNTRVWLTSLSQALGWPATLDDTPDAAFDPPAAMGVGWIWLS